MSTESRIQELAREHLGLDRDLELDARMGDAEDISSLDAVAFIQKVGEAFGVTIPPDQVANLESMRGLVAYLDSQSE